MSGTKKPPFSYRRFSHSVVPPKPKATNVPRKSSLNPPATTSGRQSDESDVDPISVSDVEMMPYARFGDTKYGQLKKDPSTEFLQNSVIPVDESKKKIKLSLSQEQIVISRSDSQNLSKSNSTLFSNSLITINIGDSDLSRQDITSINEEMVDDTKSQPLNGADSTQELCEAVQSIDADLAKSRQKIEELKCEIQSQGEMEKSIVRTRPSLIPKPQSNSPNCSINTSKSINIADASAASTASRSRFSLPGNMSPRATLRSTAVDGVAAVGGPPPNQGAGRFMTDKLVCTACKNVFCDPRVLDCLHTFCLLCLSGMEMAKGGGANSSEGSDYELNSSNTTLKQSRLPSTLSLVSACEPELPKETRSSFSTLKLRKTLKAKKKETPTRTRVMQIPTIEKKIIICPVCDTVTELSSGGCNRLPQNFIILRRLEVAAFGADLSTPQPCNLCNDSAPASFGCTTCRKSMCSFCKDAHLRQRLTSKHDIRTLTEIHAAQIEAMENEKHKKDMKCQLHIGQDLKLFCTSCFQVVCNDCSEMLHRGHKCEPIFKAYKTYMKIIRDSVDRTRPIGDYANHSITKMGGISKRVGDKAALVQTEVDCFLTEYFQALEVHRRTLLHQIVRAKDSKIHIINDKKSELEKRSAEASTAIHFTEELLLEGNDIEILSFVGILLRRFEYCHNFKDALDPKISDSLQFLPDIRAPSTSAQNNIPLYGIITTQTASAKYCVLETEGFMFLRVNRKAELILYSKDNDNVPLCHGGLIIQVELKYKDSSAKALPTQVSDKRDGTYLISFMPDAPGLLTLCINIKDKPIKGSPFNLCARTLRPHSGIFHCCTFCTTGGSKTALCACEGVMPGGYRGCGHGHEGHPGRRHWSCCGLIYENSECTASNAFR